MASRYTDSAIVAAATAIPALHHRPAVLPDKAIDLIDEASSRIRMEIDSKPEVMDRLDRRLIQLKIEREALKKETDEASRNRGWIPSQRRGWPAGTRVFRCSEEVWKAEKAAVSGAAQVKEELDRARMEHGDRAQRAGNLNRMSGELQYGLHPGAAEGPRAEASQAGDSGDTAAA
jgi:ATP-dependent Clp protease ATP-binding subunit ClpB